MLLDFLRGNKRTLNRNDFLDLVKSYNQDEFIHTKQFSDKVENFYVFAETENKYYIFGSQSFSSGFTLFIDEENKKIFVNKTNIFTQFNYIYFNTSTPSIILNNMLDDYKIIDVEDTISLINKERKLISDNYIISNKDNILDNRDCVYEYNIEEATNELLYKLFVQQKENELPSLLDDIILTDLKSNHLISIIDNFLFNYDTFKNKTIESIENKFSGRERSYSIKIVCAYFLANEAIKSNKIDKNMILAKDIYTVLSNHEGKTVKVFYKNRITNEIVSCSCDNKLFNYDLRKHNSYNYVSINDIQKITYGRNVLFEKA